MSLTTHAGRDTHVGEEVPHPAIEDFQLDVLIGESGNAYPWHPHKPGNRQSNRTSMHTERTAGLSMLTALLSAFPNATLFAVGRNAEAALLKMGHHAILLRHPFMGGATMFRSQLRKALVRTGD
ncbi:MAG: hypothetical protein ABI859_06750 [Pseudomonadota bacterium]